MARKTYCIVLWQERHSAVCYGNKGISHWAITIKTCCIVQWQERHTALSYGNKDISHWTITRKTYCIELWQESHTALCYGKKDMLHLAVTIKTYCIVLWQERQTALSYGNKDIPRWAITFLYIGSFGDFRLFMLLWHAHVGMDYLQAVRTQRRLFRLFRVIISDCFVSSFIRFLCQNGLLPDY